jgi:hypothetical protein
VSSQLLPHVPVVLNIPHGSLLVASRTLASISVKFITAASTVSSGQLAMCCCCSHHFGLCGTPPSDRRA